MTSPALSELTTMKVGGPARLLISATTREELIDAAEETWDSPEPWLVLGGGSNLVVADEGFDGTVIHVQTRGILRIPGTSTIQVAAGESWDGTVAWAVENNLAGIEALSGIPGTVGAAPIQNIGAYGQEVASVITAVEFLDATTREISRIPAEELGFGYRDSIFKQGRRGIVLTVEMELTESAESMPIAFPQLATALKVELGATVPLNHVRETVWALRSSKGMVLDPSDPDTFSAGSFFMNPLVTENFARGLPADAPKYPVDAATEDRVLGLNADVPALAPPTLVKLSAAWLIEKAGIPKGFQLPGSGAAISSKHTLAITNRNNASAADIIGLAGYVQALVQSHFGVILHPEPLLVDLDL